MLCRFLKECNSKQFLFHVTWQVRKNLSLTWVCFLETMSWVQWHQTVSLSSHVLLKGRMFNRMIPLDCLFSKVQDLNTTPGDNWNPIMEILQQLFWASCLSELICQLRFAKILQP